MRVLALMLVLVLVLELRLSGRRTRKRDSVLLYWINVILVSMIGLSHAKRREGKDACIEEIEKDETYRESDAA